MRSLEEMEMASALNALQQIRHVESMIESFMISGAFMQDLSLVTNPPSIRIDDAKIDGKTASFNVTVAPPFRMR